MGLIEILTLEVGATVAKAILKVWLKPNESLNNLGDSFVDIIKSKIPDLMAQRNGLRQFEAIGDKVAESLLPVFQNEKGLSENGRSAVALAVADTLKKANVAPALLAECNLEPIKLSNYLLTSNANVEKDFSEVERSLYRRSLAETSRLIIDIASQLPTFTERTFSEVLKREEYILEIATKILDEVSRIRTASQQPEEIAEAFEGEYRSSVIRTLDRLELIGVDVSNASRRHRLSIAYVKLNVKHRVTRELKKQPAEIFSVDTALAKSNRVMIVGDAGSGKSTLLQWVAVRSAAIDFPDGLSTWQNTLPFVVRLRQCVDKGLPSPEEFPHLVAPSISDLMPHGWTHSQLKSGRGILLIDGVDEFPESERQDVFDWLEDLINTFPRMRTIVTSRPYAIIPDWLEKNNFSYAELKPMDMGAIQEFVDHWHNAVKDELINIEEKNELDNLSTGLLNVVQKNHDIYSLATNPLLCAMLCALHRDRMQHLPSDRIELYDAGCAMLLERRDVERRIELKGYPRLAYRQKRVILQDLAYWMIKNGWSEIEIAKVVDRISKQIENMEGLSASVVGKDVYRLLIHRSGLVREPILGKFDFTHRSFQEYLAAKAALDQSDISTLLQNAENDLWREVIVLAVGSAGEKVCQEIINGLIDKGDANPKIKHKLHLLANACIEIALELPPDVRAKMQLKIKQILPPKNLDDAQALVAAGDLVIPHLTKLDARVQTNDLSIEACVYVLTNIKKKEALEILQSYSNQANPIVIERLIQGWLSYDEEEYFEKIIHHLISKRSSLELQKIRSLRGFQRFGSLEGLTIDDCHEITDLSPIAFMQGLRELNLRECTQIKDLSFLSPLNKLHSLVLSDFENVMDLKPLAKLTSLRFVSLRNFPKVADLSPLDCLDLKKRTIEEFPLIFTTPVYETPKVVIPKKKPIEVVEVVPNLKASSETYTRQTPSRTTIKPLKIFLSHASGDRSMVRALYAKLRNENFDVWLDAENLLPGQDWELEIEKAVRAADVVLVCISKNSISKAGYVQKEMKMALDMVDYMPEGAIFIVPVRLEDCEVPARLARLQWVDLFSNDGYQRLLRALNRRSEMITGVSSATNTLPTMQGESNKQDDSLIKKIGKLFRGE